jgi:phage gp36-like protein
MATITQYCTTTDLDVAFSRDEKDTIANRTDDGVYVADTAVVTAVIAKASAEMDTYIRKGKYALPITVPAPAVLLGICVDICRYYLYLDQIPDGVAERYKNAVAILEDIAKGEVQLVNPDGTIPATAGNSSFFYGDRVFSREKLRGM